MNNFILFSIGFIVAYFLIEIKNNCWIQSSAKAKLNQIIQILVRQCSRWSSAALNDESPLIATMHANYGAAYLWALKDFATDNDVKTATGVDLKRLELEVTKIQDWATKKAVKMCPEYGPSSTYLTKIAGEGN